jgi:hypothetical protein
VGCHVWMAGRLDPSVALISRGPPALAVQGSTLNYCNRLAAALGGELAHPTHCRRRTRGSGRHKAAVDVYLHEFQRRHHQVRGAVAPGCLRLEHDLPCGVTSARWPAPGAAMTLCGAFLLVPSSGRQRSLGCLAAAATCISGRLNRTVRNTRNWPNRGRVRNRGQATDLAP